MSTRSAIRRAALTVGAVAALTPSTSPLFAQTGPATGSVAAVPPVREVVLDNGLRLLLLPRDGAPTVSFVMQYSVGGVHEGPGETGVAHLLEHMLFKGSESIGTTDLEAERALFARMDRLHQSVVEALDEGRPDEVQRLRAAIGSLEDEARQYVISNEFDQILGRAGAQGLNATTNSESTTYFVELPANRTELFFALEADRMSHPVFREFYSERDVVMEERRMRVDASPGGTLYERHLAAAFTEHPYGQPVVGTMADLERLGRTDVERYYRNYYGPNNAVLAVVGSFDPEQAYAWARQYLEPIPRGLPPPPVRGIEPAQTAERRVTVEWDAEPALRLGWHVPASTDVDGPAVAMLSVILTGGRTSRLYRRLVSEERRAVSVFASTGPGRRFPQLFQIDVTPVGSSDLAEIENAIYEEIHALATTGPTEEEVTRVRNQIEAGAVRRLQSNLGLAFQIVEAESLFGDWRQTFHASELLKAVTPEQVRQAAARYLTESNRSVAVLQRASRSTGR